MNRSAALVLGSLAACGSDHGQPIDARLIDAPIDVAVDAPVDVPPPAPGHYHFVLDHQAIPQTNNQARTYGLDLDSDGNVDNQLGMVLATLSGMGFDTQGATDKAVDTGKLLTLVDLYADNFTTSTMSTVTTYDGANPFPAPCTSITDTVCRHHLTGTAMFTEASAMDTPLAGTTTAGVYTGGPGHLEIQLAAFGPPAAKLTLIGARVKLTGTTATGITQGVIAGGVSQTDIQTKLEPAMRDSFMALVQKDCTGGPPTCGCVDGSTGKTVIGLFDTNHDCLISLTEIQNNSLIQSLLAPDVTLEAQMALSFGFGFTAVPGAFAP